MFELPRVEKLYKKISVDHLFKIENVTKIELLNLFRITMECSNCNLNIILYFNDVVTDCIYYLKPEGYILLEETDIIYNCNEYCCKDIIE